MKIAYYSADEPEFACARLRVLCPLELLAPEVEVASAVEMIVRRTGAGSKQVEYRVDAGAADGADLVVIQRSFPRPSLQKAVAEIFATGKPVVYETDDDLRIVPQWRGELAYRQYVPFIEEVASRAALVTVSTPHLRARFAPLNASTAVLPNYLPHSLWRGAPHFRRRSERLTIGYCGTRTHEQDLALVEDALVETCRRHRGVQLVFLGCATERLRRLPDARYFAFDGAYRTWPRRLAEAGIDIAVVPLVDEPFNNCKSAIKFLELGYLEIPAVFSDVAPYRDAVENGVTGLLAPADGAAWLEALERLIADSQLRERIGFEARRAVTAHHLLEAHCGRWLEAYRSVL